MLKNLHKITNKVIRGNQLNTEEALLLADADDIELLTEAAAIIRDQGHGNIITYAPKVIIPFTSFCDDQWDYCTISNIDRNKTRIYLTKQEILAIAKRGLDVGCVEVLFFLAAKPEQYSEAAKQELQALGYDSTLDYLAAMAKMCFEQTSLLPKLHSGVLTRDELSKLRKVSLAQGLMLDSRTEYLCEDGASSYGATNQHPYVRLGVTAAAGAMNVPFTSGIIIGIGESRRERIDTLLGLRDLANTCGHLQEIVIQNYRHPAEIRGNRLSKSMLKELLWTIAVSRILFGAEANIQAPADLPNPALAQMLEAGINDWGSVIPVNIGLVGSDVPWPQLERIKATTKAHGKQLRIRLPLYPAYIKESSKWLDSCFFNAVEALTDEQGLVRSEATLAINK